MADGDLLVTISGAALSLLFFENVRSVGDQMGFLLGEVLEFIVKSYTDSDNQVETVKTHINVETIVTCPLPALLIESANRISKEKLKDFICDKSKQVVGWFRFRRNTSSLIPTLKDRLLHKEFASLFSELSEDSCKKDFFLTCLLNASTSETRGTHKFRHVFLRHKRGMFEPIPLRISNLGDDASRHDGSDYKPTPVRKVARASDDFSKLIESLKLDMRLNGLESAMLIQKLAEKHLTTLIPKVRESDLEVAELERQVRELKAKVKAQQLAKNSKVNGENCEKTNRKNCVLEKYDSSMRSEMKVGDDVREHALSCVQPVSLNRTIARNTAAYIAKSVNQDKSRRIVVGNQEDGNQQGTQDFLVNKRRPIQEIASEPICQEDSEICMSRGRGRGVYEFTSGMKKGLRNPDTAQMHSFRERNTTSPEQDFSDIECSAAAPLSPSVTRSYTLRQRKQV
ncbi:hypothetical protein DMN91_004736 [Ooceraea biroi]|uniref:BRCA1-A complex subunit Abraxas n=1 Tax=Ooceraea biroi TaxID=2015173 RepID=A0A026WC97_OOCBI|nr:BRISC complex subunit FAM175B [Ooceraea biroi]EZA53296.1 BRCA1-A complex subunit Abraxas [Ooceraea biroi]RLU22458.1 hypothetical protein DMN91_004736 [Ooceraea biroi]